jgi:hypothetical protein
MPTSSTGYDTDGELPPPGSRWGSGAGSVLPYLTKSLQAKPSSAQDTRDAKAREGQQQQPSQERPTASAA